MQRSDSAGCGGVVRASSRREAWSKVVDPKNCLVIADTKSMCCHHPPSPLDSLVRVCWRLWRGRAGVREVVRGGGRSTRPPNMPRLVRGRRALASKQMSKASLDLASCATCLLARQGRHGSSRLPQPQDASHLLRGHPLGLASCPGGHLDGRPSRMAALPPLSPFPLPLQPLPTRPSPSAAAAPKVCGTHQHAAGRQWKDTAVGGGRRGSRARGANWIR